MENLKTQYAPQIDYESMNSDFFRYFAQGNAWLTEFKKKHEFEKQLANNLNSTHCHTMNNGTISLAIALWAAGVRAGDEVLVPALTMIATYNAVLFIGARPVLVDILQNNLCMDLNDANRKYTNKTKAMIYVTLNGRSGNPFDIKAFCRIHNLAYIEDDAQSLFSQYSNESFIGSAADIASFSFSPQKIITTGQGGCLMTGDEALSNRIVQLRDFGRATGGVDIHPTFGINSKFTDLQALAGLNQLKDIEHKITKKKFIYHGYRQRLKDSLVEFIHTDLTVTIPWFVDIYVQNRNGLAEWLEHNGIATRNVYPTIASQHFVESYYQYPVADWYSQHGLWLPCSLDITTEEIKYVCDKIKEFYS